MNIRPKYIYIYIYKIYNIFSNYMGFLQGLYSTGTKTNKVTDRFFVESIPRPLILACINLMILCCWKLSLLLWKRKILTYFVKSIAKIQKPIQKFIANSSQKLLLEHSFQTVFNNYFQRNPCKHYLVIIVRKSFETSL